MLDRVKIPEIAPPAPILLTTLAQIQLPHGFRFFAKKPVK
jgi:hypothetical protein